MPDTRGVGERVQRWVQQRIFKRARRRKKIVKPIGKYVVIKTIEEELKTSSGLLLSAEDANQLRYKKGKIVAVGTEVVAIEKDSEIYYDKRAGYTMLIHDEPYTIIRENDIVLVV